MDLRAFLLAACRQRWRLQHGALLDVGQHVLDLLDAAVGPIRLDLGRGDLHAWVSPTAVHEGGAVSDAAISAVVPWLRLGVLAVRPCWRAARAVGERGRER